MHSLAVKLGFFASKYQLFINAITCIPFASGDQRFCESDVDVWDYYINETIGAESAPPLLTETSNYINYVIPIDMKPPVENYENIGFNGMRVPLVSAKGTTEDLTTIWEAESQNSYENEMVTNMKR